MATKGTHEIFRIKGIESTFVKKVQEGRPHIVDVLKDGKINLVINTTSGKQSVEDSFSLRRTTLVKNIPYCTTMAGATAAVRGIESLLKGNLAVTSLQEYYKSDK